MIWRITLYIFMVISFCFVMDLVYNISLFFKEKRNYQFMINNKEKDTKSKMTMLERVDTTLEILNLCNTLIDNEITKSLQACVRLKKPYDIKRIDTDVKLIATEVFNSIKPEILISDDIILSEKFLMQHITDETILRLLKSSQEFNSIIRNS